MEFYPFSTSNIQKNPCFTYLIRTHPNIDDNNNKSASFYLLLTLSMPWPDPGGVHQVPVHPLPPPLYPDFVHQVKISCRDIARWRSSGLVPQLKTFLTCKPRTVPPVLPFVPQLLGYTPQSALSRSSLPIHTSMHILFFQYIVSEFPLVVSCSRPNNWTHWFFQETMRPIG